MMGSSNIQRTLLLCALSLGLGASAFAQQLTWLGTVPGGSWSRAYAVSDSGKVVVGRVLVTVGTQTNWHAFRWTPNSGMVDLGTLGGPQSVAWDVSADGSVVVGWSEDASGKNRAFRWTAATGMVALGTLPGGGESMAFGVSADGSVIVGCAIDSNGEQRAFRWTAATGMQDLGSDLGHQQTCGFLPDVPAVDVSADGTVVVGTAVANLGGGSYNWRAFRWTASTGMQNLGTLGGESRAYAISADGSTVVGTSDFTGSQQFTPFRWTSATGMQDIGDPNRDAVSAWGVSLNGSTIVGGGRYAFRWTATGGIEDLNQTYFSLVGYSSLNWATDISSNGRYIVGYGYHLGGMIVEAFLLDTGGLIVNSTADRSDQNPGDGACDTGQTIQRGNNTEAECTLRAALEEANANTGPDQIQFDIPTSDPGYANGVCSTWLTASRDY